MTASTSSSNKSSTTSSILQMLRSRKTSSSSSSSSPHTTQHDGDNNVRTTTCAHHRLTRQKKLRYLTDQDVGLHMQSWASPDHPKHGFDFRPSSSSAVPLPLPLPCGSSPNASPNSTCPRKSVDHFSSSTNVARSPRKFCRKFNQDLAQKNVTSNLNLNEPLNCALETGSASLPVSPERSYCRDLHISHVVTTPVEFVNNSLSGSYHAQKFENSIERFRVKVPARSAPASSLSSPITSPRTTNAVDVLPLLRSQEYWDRPASDSSGAIELAAPREVSPLKNVLSPDHSPPQSPKGQRPLLKPRSMDELIFPSPHSLLPGSSIERPGCNNHVASHPLPLPPRNSSAAISSTSTPSASTHQSLEKPNVSIIKGQWQKGKLIGQGTFGRVYAATNRQTGALCAMKEVDIIPDDPKSAECIKQLEQEIKLLSQLKHPNIVQYYGSEIVGDQLYIYLEYVHPGSINKYIRDHCEIIEEPVVRNFTRHILSGLAYLHSEKKVHRDIKGANLLVNASGIVKLADFGLAKHLSGKAYDLSLKGSPYWMAPEIMQAAMLKDANPDLAFAVDIWSLGCTIIEMLTGKPPWSEVEGQVAMFKVLNKTPTIPEILSSDGKDFLHCCFRRDPAARPSAAMLLEHPFVQNSHEQQVSVCTKAISRMELSDIYKPISPKVYAKSTNVFLFNCTENRNGIRQCYSETCQQINSPVSARASGSRHNPFGKHEVHSPSTKQISCRESKLSQSTNFLSNRQLVELHNHHYPQLKSRKQDITHL